MIPSWSYELIGEYLIEQSKKEQVSFIKKSDSEISMENVLNSIETMDVEMLNVLIEEFDSGTKQHKIIITKEICLWEEIECEIKNLLGYNYDLIIRIGEIFI